MDEWVETRLPLAMLVIDYYQQMTTEFSADGKYSFEYECRPVLSAAGDPAFR